MRGQQVVGRNFDNLGSLPVFLISTRKIVNRAKILRELNPNPELRLLISNVCGNIDYEIDDLILPKTAHRGDGDYMFPNEKVVTEEDEKVAESPRNFRI